eukprot:CAMPEP_0182927012 /NCGR_PEP_ID=MMETSP0105_2-20130417/12943_1 /TAXON_ID=81532 ORGANISM="Acanthoeca-like sp., Strain 10tr" /NCGR_SAMPLE_ID=MMETSP0105_2 /ASSEMBLY_ACC=CAM_ASM_000205 /LENGTH=122 /DNA_ID=CAMNT_0025064937 /DNA_START=377 /DNA_END=745 /DNA_ORIENTATION=+
MATVPQAPYKLGTIGALSVLVACHVVVVRGAEHGVPPIAAVRFCPDPGAMADGSVDPSTSVRASARLSAVRRTHNVALTMKVEQWNSVASRKVGRLYKAHKGLTTTWCDRSEEVSQRLPNLP